MDTIMWEPRDFRRKGFMDENKRKYDLYMWLRAIGRTSRAALRISFGDCYADHPFAQSYIDHIECNPNYICAFEEMLKGMKAEQFWSPAIAAYELLAFARNPSINDSARLGAMKELNVICGITFVDEKGNTRAGRNFSDFYKDAEAGSFSRHPEPGSPKAKHLVDSLKMNGAADSVH